MKDVREAVREFYTSAAETPKQGLCCPTAYDSEDTAHIPKDALQRAYGCGSPVSSAGLKKGEVVLDLGSGSGVDCFIASKKVGKEGRVIGVDMTDKMIELAEGYLEKVAENLGYRNVEFKKGYLEEIPLEDESVDVVISNCVINLSSDKERVMQEVYRVLKHRGRFCIADIVSEKDVPQSVRENPTLWGECIGGAIKEEDFINIARSAGAYGINIKSRTFYREVEGVRFNSVIITGYKFIKGKECVYRGHYAIYNGPFRSVRDDDGHEYPAGVPVEICTDTLEKLTNPPYAGMFTIITAEGETVVRGCVDETEGCC